MALASACIAAVHDTDPARNPAAPDPPAACHYQAAAYSAGAVLRMERIEKVCAIVDGTPTWVRG